MPDAMMAWLRFHHISGLLAIIVELDADRVLRE